MRKVVVCIDSSEFSNKAFHAALKWMSCDDELVLFHVAQEAFDPYYDELEQGKGKQLANDYAQLCLAKKVPKYSWKSTQAVDARDAIYEMVLQEKPDLVVLGSRGIGAVKRLLIGSVSSYCVQNLPVPVMVVK